MSEKITILIIDNEPLLIKMWERQIKNMEKVLNKSFEIIGIRSASETEKILEMDVEINIVAISATLKKYPLTKGKIADTAPLVRKIRGKFLKVPMIAMSVIPDFRKELEKAGCNYGCLKESLTKKIKKILISNHRINN